MQYEGNQSVYYKPNLLHRASDVMNLVKRTTATILRQ